MQITFLFDYNIRKALSGWTKAKRSAAAKKAARTKKAKKKKGVTSAVAKKAKRKKGVTSAVAKKAKAAGTIAEKEYVRKLQKMNNLVLNGKGIPDIIAQGIDGWKFYEVKPHMQRVKKTGKWKVVSENRRLLNSNQRREFKKLVWKGVDVNIVYYYRKRYGSKTRPKYKFKYQLVKLGKNAFKSRKGPDPVKLQLIDKKLKHWMKTQIV